MGKITEVTMHCSRGKGKYLAKFEEQAPGEWFGVSAEKIAAPSIWDKLGLTTKRSRHSENKQVEMKGAFYSGTLSCPYCGNTGFICCGACNELSCNPDGANKFHCGACGINGEITGTIEALEGNERGGGPDMEPAPRSSPNRHL